MWPHVRDFRDYYRSVQGRLTRRALQKKLQAAVGNVRDQRVLAIGFATPYLYGFLKTAESVTAVMSGRSGAVVWPYDGPCHVAIADETDLPFRERTFDCVILIHSLEWSDVPHTLMREVWRVLDDEGRLIIVVPNRRSLWARLDLTPFGFGRPYSRGQLMRLLDDAMFTTTWVGGALLVPPGRSRFWFSLGKVLESIAGRFLTRVSALTMATASKRRYGVTPVGLAIKTVNFAEVLSRSSRQSGAHSRNSVDKICED